MELLKVKFLDSTVANKKPVMRGEVLELEKNEAQFLINIKKAELFIEEKEEPIADQVKEIPASLIDEAKPIKAKKGK